MTNWYKKASQDEGELPNMDDIQFSTEETQEIEWEMNKMPPEAKFPSIKSSIMRILMAVEELTRNEKEAGDEAETYTFASFPFASLDDVRHAIIRKIWIAPEDADLHIEYDAFLEDEKNKKTIQSTLKQAEEYFPGLARAIHGRLYNGILKDSRWGNEDVSLLLKAFQI